MSCTYVHSGDAGDVIYGLPCLRGFGGGTLVLSCGMGTAVREPFTAAKADSMAKLLQLQPYVHRVIFDDKGTIPFTHDGDLFRREPYRRFQLPDSLLAHLKQQGKTFKKGKQRTPLLRRLLTDWQLRVWNLDTHHRDTPWLRVDKDPDAPAVLFSRTPRFHNEAFPWRAVADHYVGRAAFVGHPEEHALFCRDVLPVPHYPTPDHLALARAIAGTKLFVANQSMPFALSVGLGRTHTILESCPTAPDCNYERAHIVLGTGPDVIRLLPKV